MNECMLLAECPECGNGIETCEPVIPATSECTEEGTMFHCVCPACQYSWAEGPFC